MEGRKLNFRTLTLPDARVYVCMCACYHRARVCIRGLKIALTIYIFSLFNFQRIDVRYNVIIWITHVGSFNLYVVSRSYLFETLFFCFPEKNPSRTCFTSECFFEIIYLHKMARNEKFPLARLRKYYRSFSAYRTFYFRQAYIIL